MIGAVDLDPVVQVGLEHLTRSVYRHVKVLGLVHRRRRFYGLQLQPKALNNRRSHARAAAVHLFKHLRHHGYRWDSAHIRSWLLSRGWKRADAETVAEYARGVLAGERYHTSPDPWGRHAIQCWLEEASLRCLDGGG
jgi:hypothetical protein